MSSRTKAPVTSTPISVGIDRHRERLRALIGRKLQDQVEAEDVLQDVFEEYLEASDLDVAIDSLGAWLVRVAQNKIIDRFRRKNVRKNYLDETLLVDDLEVEFNGDNPEDELMRKFLREQITEALSMLPENQRTVFMLHELEGLSFEEISKQLGVGINTLLARKRYAIQFLREHLKEIYDELE